MCLVLHVFVVFSGIPCYVSSTIPHALAAYPQKGGLVKSGEKFNLTCIDGFYASENEGSILCGGYYVWKNQPKCLGNDMLPDCLLDLP